MLDIDRNNEPRKPLRDVAEGYKVYDYPREDAEAVAKQAADLFGPLFDRVVPSIGLAGQKVPSRYIYVRGTPFVNYSSTEKGNGAGVVVEAPDGDLALEIRVHKGPVQTGDGEFNRWDTELRAPDWRLIATTASELT